MAILIDENTRLLVQAITGREGSLHTARMKAYGTNVVAGVTPGKGGAEVQGVPVFNTIREAVEATQPNASVIFVPGPYSADAAMEAVANQIPLIVDITEHMPV